ncbi:hypothetical protein A2501_00095 [Candidatus Uhrbacteria bacterium RIFOXYC12_FULL_57_11]|nr:MAG: hypothetical protein A2501_00095 [Candidatus Uhrbacteria bacterium RIFOXYC12_FULL_57_11]
MLSVVLSVIGFGISGYSFAHHESFVSGAFCNVNDSFSCDIVNRGPYSDLFGIPVALIGMIGYTFLFAGSVLCLKRPEDLPARTFLLLAAAGGLAFSFYLTGIEAFVLKTWCLLCLMSQLSIAAIFAMSAHARIKMRRRK